MVITRLAITCLANEIWDLFERSEQVDAGRLPGVQMDGVRQCGVSVAGKSEEVG